MRRTRGPGGRPLVVLLALAALGIGRSALAEEWHEAYRLGLSALAKGDAAQAVLALQRAVAKRPEPGRNVVTYGTNVEARYFPYLRLAEAHLALGQHAKARAALQTSATWGREPADERQQIEARIAAAEPKVAAPVAPPATPSTAVTPVTTSPPAPLATATPAPTPTLAPEAMPTPSAPPTTAGPRTLPTSAPPRAPATLVPAPERPSGPPPAVGTIEIVSEPPGAHAYLDDEPLGSTDPHTGRLLKTGLAAGRHRVRVSRTGHEDLVRDIDLVAGERASVYATLTPSPGTTPPAGIRPELLALAATGLALIAVIAWIAFRRPHETPSHVFVPTPRSPGEAPSSATPASPVTPGGRRDEWGQEWFGDFRLLSLLGRGGMASVYKAERRGEIAALKRPLANYLEDPEFIERFLREADIGRTLNHPNIVRIVERGAIERVPYFTMELLEGETLQAVVRRGPLPPRRAAQLVAQVTEALDFAHGKGVIHRDLKPSNIMLLGDGTAKVMDFGIARARRFEGLTATGAFLGTPDYVAPETIEGRGSEARSDLYALGVILFELLTGERPFVADTPFALLKMHCNDVPPLPSSRRLGVPPELDAIVQKLLGKHPEERPESAEELVVALRDWLNRAA